MGKTFSLVSKYLHKNCRLFDHSNCNYSFIIFCEIKVRSYLYIVNLNAHFTFNYQRVSNVRYIFANIRYCGCFGANVYCKFENIELQT